MVKRTVEEHDSQKKIINLSELPNLKWIYHRKRIKLHIQYP